MASDAPGPRRRLLLAALIAAGTALATRRLALALSGDGWSLPDGMILIGFALTFAWISAAFWTALAGFWVHGRRGGTDGTNGLAPPLAPLPEGARTALLVPIRHEAPEAVGLRIEAMERSLARTGRSACFDFFILSDSQDPPVVRQEQALVTRLRATLGAGGRLFYRNRRPNPGRKAGNIAEFCRRWGRRYRYFVVLDADSVMAGATLVHLARLMEANPEAGLIQTAPRLIGGRTLFARILQFAAGLYGPMLTAGLAHWFPGESNYWGHNAIVRTRAFMASAGLPTLPGEPPLGGEILSHDFVEAALLRRAGWSVWLAPDVGGSYEELPPTLRDYVGRDRRWCQGNLQHLRLLAAKGLRPVSRLHLAAGAMSYLASPVLLLLLLATTLGASGRARHPMPGLDSGPSTSPSALLGLLLITLGMLVLPRLLALALALADPSRRRAFGGAWRLIPSALGEWLFSVLLAPILMVAHAGAVLTVVLGRRVAWDTQRREAHGETWRGALAGFGGATLLGALWAALAAWLAPGMLLWLSPILPGLLLAVPIAVLASREDLGRWTRRHACFLIPEETTPPDELAALYGARAAPVEVNEHRNHGRRREVMRTAIALIVATTLLAPLPASRVAAQILVTPDPIAKPIEEGDLAVEVVDLVRAPRSGAEGRRALLNHLSHAGDGSGRLFVADSRGQILIIDDGELLATPFLDVAAILGDDLIVSNQHGLRSFAFHPDFEIPGSPGFGLMYTAVAVSETSAPADTPVFRGPGPVLHHDALIEWQLDPNEPNRVDPASARELLRIEQPLTDHNLGQIGFDPNASDEDPDYGLLYVGTGDGGNTAPTPDATGQGQNTRTLLGTILRIDPLQDGARPYRIPADNPFVSRAEVLPEIWAYGLRHPQFLSWDAGGAGAMVIADIGQAHVEEVNLGRAGANYGWGRREGTFATDPDDHSRLYALPVDDRRFGFTYPVAQYDHDEGRAIAGGYVYRGTAVPELAGKYLFGDIVNGRIFYVDVADLALGRQAEIQELVLLRAGVPTTLLDLVDAGRADLRFGQGEDGELYVLTKQDGMIRTFAAPD